MPYFSRFLCYIFSFGYSGLNCEFICGEYGFSIYLKISLMSSGDQPILTFRISVTNFLHISIFSDFDIKILHLG